MAEEREGEYTDSELPLDAELTKDEAAALREGAEDADVEIDIVEVDDDDPDLFISPEE